MQRLIHNSGGYGIGRPAIEEPRHEKLHERRIGIEFEIIEAREFIPGLMHRQPPVGLSGEAQHFVRKTVEQSTHPAPSKVGGRGSLGGPCVETAVLVFLAAAARAGVVAARFHLPASRIGFGSAVTRWPGRPRRACVVSRAKSRSARLARASCRSNGGCAGSTVLFLAVYGLLRRSSCPLPIVTSTCGTMELGRRFDGDGEL